MNKKGNNTNRDVNLENNKEKQKFKISKSDLKILIFSVFGVVIGFALGYLIFYNESTALFGKDNNDCSNLQNENESINTSGFVITSSEFFEIMVKKSQRFDTGDILEMSSNFDEYYGNWLSCFGLIFDGFTDESKMAYALADSFIRTAEQYTVSDMMNKGEDTEYIKIEVNRGDLETLISNYFVTYQIININYNVGHYNYDVSCDDDLCEILIRDNYQGGTGFVEEYKNFYTVTKTNDGFIVDVKTYYIDYFDEDHENDPIKIYDYKGGSLIDTFDNLHSLENDEVINLFFYGEYRDFEEKYENKNGNFKIYFDKNYRYVKTEIV